MIGVCWRIIYFNALQHKLAKHAQAWCLPTQVQLAYVQQSTIIQCLYIRK